MAQPWFKLYSKELLADSKILQLEDAELGKLLKLWAFASQDGSIPAAPQQLCKLLRGTTHKQMVNHLVWIRKFFVPAPGDDSRLFSPRLQLEQQVYQDKCQKLRQNGTKGGRPKEPEGYPDGYPKGKPDKNQKPPEAETETETEKEQQPPTPFGAGTPSADADTAAVVPVEPVTKKAKPKQRDKRYTIAALEMPQAVAEAFEHCWDDYPKTGWDFRTKSAQPRRINRALAAERFGEVCKHLHLETGDGRKLNPEDLTDAVLAWVDRKRMEAQRQYGPGHPPCVPCIANVFSSIEGSKKHYQEALLEFFGVAEGVS